MAKRIKEKVKLQLVGGKAFLESKLMQIFGMKGIRNHADNFCKEFNKLTEDKKGQVLTVHIFIYDDNTIEFKIKGEVITVALLNAVKVQKGSGSPNLNKIGSLRRDQIREIARRKLPYLNAYNLESAEKIIKATAISMGIEIEEFIKQ